MSASVLASAKGSVAELALVLLLWCEGGFSRGRGWGFSGGRRHGGYACTWHRGRWSVAWVRVGQGLRSENWRALATETRRTTTAWGALTATGWQRWWALGKTDWQPPRTIVEIAQTPCSLARAPVGFKVCRLDCEGRCSSLGSMCRSWNRPGGAGDKMAAMAK